MMTGRSAEGYATSRSLFGATARPLQETSHVSYTPPFVGFAPHSLPFASSVDPDVAAHQLESDRSRYVPSVYVLNR